MFRIVRQIKNNLAPSDGEIRFSITAEEGFRWLECRIPTDPEAESEHKAGRMRGSTWEAVE